MKKRTRDRLRRLAYGLVLAGVLLLHGAAVGCPGFGLGVQVERDGKTVGGECHKNPDGTWACSVKAHLDSGDHTAPPEE